MARLLTSRLSWINSTMLMEVTLNMSDLLPFLGLEKAPLVTKSTLLKLEILNKLLTQTQPLVLSNGLLLLLIV